MQFEDFTLKTNVLAFASRSKAKAKPRRRTPACSSTRTVPISERSWTDIEPEILFVYRLPSVKTAEYSSSSWSSTTRRRWSDQILEIKDYLRNKFVHSQHWSGDMWKSTMARGGGNKKRFQYYTDPSGQEILDLRALQGHPGPNPIDPSLQDNVFIPNDIFEYTYHFGCAINLHSITNSGLIPGGQNLSNRHTVFFLPVDPMDKSHKDPKVIHLDVPRHAQYLHNAWKKRQNTVYLVDINLAIKKGLTFFQTRSNAIILYDTLPFYCIPKAIMMETGEIIYKKVCASPRPPKISFIDNWMKESGSDVAGGSEDSNKSNQNPEPNYQARRDP